MQLAPDEYQCCLCGHIYTKAVSDEEAMEETHEYWPDVEMEQCGIVCDDCWEAKPGPFVIE
jgi:rubredoxin